MSSRYAIVALAVAVGAAPPEARASDDGLGEPPRTVVPEMTSGPVQVLPPVLPGQHLSGTAFLGYRGIDRQTTGAIVTAAPWWKSFVRLGAELTPRSRDGDVRFLWGLGFEDWRDNSFFLHVHDWGPVRPDDSFTLKDAEASLGYKLPSLCGGPFCIAPSAFATLPFRGGPYLGARTTFLVARTWFATGGLGWTIPGALEGTATPPEWRVSFALGRWDWRPGGLFLTYRDEMQLDRLRTWDTTERKGNGVVAAGVNWSY
ncbi:hypothetical protein [Anaeromyxobacter sp. SG17]|uniref:hypothetical protein n=1 Tax=Anaeromyxobacter sp. SG17 TaxID=2925405 RepID=UPI001F590743|nr:hypothetical protein [Anaeromyxobacter sp. SG17]